MMVDLICNNGNWHFFFFFFFLRLSMFQLKTNFEITFTPLCVFGSNRKYGQMENQLHIVCKITHFSCKTNAAFILPSNEFQDSQTEREREPTHAPTNYTPLTHTHQPHFSSNPRTTLNSTHSPTPSSDHPAKPRPAQIVLPPLPRSCRTTEITP